MASKHGLKYDLYYSNFVCVFQGYVSCTSQMESSKETILLVYLGTQSTHMLQKLVFPAAERSIKTDPETAVT